MKCMNDKIIKLLLFSDRFMSEMPFTYSACGSSTKKEERIQKTRNTKRKHDILEKLDKACFSMTF